MNAEVLQVFISRLIKRRILIDLEQLSRLFGMFEEMRSISLSAATEDDRRYLERRKVEVSLKLTDGSEYTEENSHFVGTVRTSSDRLVESLEIKSNSGVLSGTVKLNRRKYYDAASIQVSGPEDKAQYYAERIDHCLNEKNDVTVNFYRLWPVPTTILVLIVSIIPFLVRDPSFFKMAFGVQVTLLGIVIMICSTAGLMLSILVERVRDNWLPNVAFLWGADQTRYERAKLVCGWMLIGLPVWLLSNFSAGLLF